MAKMRLLNKRCSLIVGLLAVVVVLFGCAQLPNEEKTDIEFSPWQGSITERNDYKYILTEGEQTAVGNNHYIFENGIEEETKLDFIRGRI